MNNLSNQNDQIQELGIFKSKTVLNPSIEKLDEEEKKEDQNPSNKM